MKQWLSKWYGHCVNTQLHWCRSIKYLVHFAMSLCAQSYINVCQIVTSQTEHFPEFPRKNSLTCSSKSQLKKPKSRQNNYIKKLLAKYTFSWQDRLHDFSATFCFLPNFSLAICELPDLSRFFLKKLQPCVHEYGSDYARFVRKPTNLWTGWRARLRKVMMN